MIIKNNGNKLNGEIKVVKSKVSQSKVKLYEEAQNPNHVNEYKIWEFRREILRKLSTKKLWSDQKEISKLLENLCVSLGYYSDYLKNRDEDEIAKTEGIEISKNINKLKKKGKKMLEEILENAEKILKEQHNLK